MSDCTGYGFGVNVTACVSGPVGNGQTATLELTVVDSTSPPRTNFVLPQTYVINNWDGTARVIDLTPHLEMFDSSQGFTNANCDVTARLTLLPTGPNAGNPDLAHVLIEFIFENCSSFGGGFSEGPKVLENCGDAGPHLVSQIQILGFSDSVCVT